MRGKWITVCAACLLCVFMVLGSPAWALDLSQTASVAVQPAVSDWLEDLAKADVTVELYHLASALPGEGEEPVFVFDETAIGSLLSGWEDADYDTWHVMAGKAAQIILADGSGRDPTAAAALIGSDATMDDLSAGLYLLIARGETDGDPWALQTREDGTQQLYTTARSERYEYTFMPELVMLPTRFAEPKEGEESAWVFDVTALVKADRVPRMGALEIVKSLIGFGGDPATFVFRYTYESPEGEIGGDVVALSFNGEGTGRIRVDVPAGSTVTVTEEYSGASYRLVSASQQTAEITAEELSQVFFENEHISTTRTGGGVVNRFEYREEEGGWNWVRTEDNAWREDE